jgi:transketolase
MRNLEKLEEKCLYIRNQIYDMCVNAQTGHVNSAFSCVEILVALYQGGILRVQPEDPQWKDRDKFILSKGQASVALYPVLADMGFFPEEELNHFAQAKGIFGVHLQNTVPGVEITTGSLGHGFGVAAGMAFAAKTDKMDQENPAGVVALLGDGECWEGSMWETAMFASHYRLNNLTAIVDRNYLSAIDFTEDIVALEPLDEKWKSFGWRVVHIDGHSLPEIFGAMNGFRSRRNNQPLCIIADTVKGKGVGFLSDSPRWHSKAPQGEKAAIGKRQLS